MDVNHVAKAVYDIAELPLNTNIQFMTIMASSMPYIGEDKLLMNTNALQGILWMLLTTITFVMVTAVVRYIGDAIPASQAAFIRYNWYYNSLTFHYPIN